MRSAPLQPMLKRQAPGSASRLSLPSGNSGQFFLELFTLQKINMQLSEITTEQNEQTCSPAAGSQRTGKDSK